jgi:hypothetical protein
LLLEVKVQIFEGETADGWDVVVSLLLKAKEGFAIAGFLLPATIPIVLKWIRGPTGIECYHKPFPVSFFAASTNKRASLASRRLTGWIYLGTSN